MKDLKNKEWLPAAAIIVFLAVVALLCIGRLKDRHENGGEETIQEETMTETETESDYGGELPLETETESATETAEETVTETLTPPDGQISQSGVSSNDVSAGLDAEQQASSMNVQKTNEEMLWEMKEYFKENNMDAVKDLMELPWYQNMSASLEDTGTCYYYGPRNDSGMPEGMGIAVYAGNEYYYGEWKDGKRNGEGTWLKEYYPDENTPAEEKVYVSHMYRGEWADNKPNGQGQDHYDLDLSQAEEGKRYVQNVIGTFKNGRYDGDMYLTTVTGDGNEEEWNARAVEGTFSPYGAGGNQDDVPVYVDVNDENNYVWMSIQENQNQGVKEFVK